MLPGLPSIHDPAGIWMAPASQEQIEEAVAYALSACEPGATGERVQLFVRMVAMRAAEKKWGAPELAQAALDLPFDDVVNDKLRFNRPVMPADFERVIEQARKLRASLKFTATMKQVQRLVEAHPGELRLSDFHVCGHDGHNAQLYRYAPNVKDFSTG